MPWNANSAIFLVAPEPPRTRAGTRGHVPGSAPEAKSSESSPGKLSGVSCSLLSGFLCNPSNL
eukprot:6874250-Pyramimonas_sp.AAC.2